MKTRGLTVTAAAIALTLSGCSAGASGSGGDAGPDAGSAYPSVHAEAQPLLAEYGLDGLDTVAIIDRLDRLSGEERPEDLMASVRTDELLLSSGGDEFGLPIPGDRFYLSVAPYAGRTHECFYHSLTTCVGELAEADVQVRIVDETNDEVLVDTTETTFANGFIGFWLPRDIEGTVRIGYGDQAAEVDFTTAEDAPTCVTTLQLA